MTNVLRFLSLLEETVLETIQRDSVISFPGLGIFGLNPPASFSVFGHRIYFYGVLFALGFTLGILYCARRSKDFGLKSDDFYDMVILLIPLSILCARIYFVLFRLDEFAGRPLIAYFAVWEGGIAIYGGIIGGILAIWLVTRRKKLPFLAMLDLTVFGVLIGQIIGRWGYHHSITDLRQKIWVNPAISAVSPHIPKWFSSLALAHPASFTALPATLPIRPGPPSPRPYFISGLHHLT